MYAYHTKDNYGMKNLFNFGEMLKLYMQLQMKKKLWIFFLILNSRTPSIYHSQI